MDTYNNEAEQVAAIKQWWQKNARPVLTGVVAGVGLLVGWQAWQTYQTNQSIAASDRFAALQQVVAAEQTELVTAQAEQLMQEHPGTMYAVLAARQAAKVAYQADDKAGARAWLERALASAEDAVIQQAVRVQLAELLLDMQAWQDAAQVLQDATDDAFQAQIAELRGDLASHQGDLSAARAAYQQALQHSDQADPLLTLKISDLKSGETSE
jgi:predicted negative regulator of RcsB-dependent stress response